MLQRVNWHIIFGLLFTVLGVLSLFAGNQLDAAWSLVFGIGNLGIAYGQKHPEYNRSVLAWAVVVVWALVLAWLTIQRILQ